MLQSCDKLEAMEYARRGITDSLRPAVWRLMLGLPKVGRSGQVNDAFIFTHRLCGIRGI